MSEDPRFALRRVFEDGSATEAAVVPVTAMPWETRLGRRGILGVGLSAAALARSLASGAQTQSVGLKAHHGEITALAASPDGSLLVTAGKDTLTKIWKPFKPDSPVHMPARSLPVNALTITGGGAVLIAASSDYGIHRIALPEGRLQAEAPRDSNYLKGLDATTDGGLVVFGGWDKAPRLWTAGSAEFRRLEGHSRYVTAVALSPDGKTLLSGAWDSTVRIWSLPDGTCTKVLEGHSGYVEHLLMLDGERAVSGASDGTIRLWSLKEQREEARFDFGAGPVRALAASPGGKKLFAACGEAGVRVLDLAELREEGALEGHRAAVTTLACASAGRLLASGDMEGTVILWDGEAGTLYGYLFDEKANSESARKYNAYDKRTATTVSYTLPCGSPLPAGAVCTCNCVRGGAGGVSAPVTRCTCDQVCTCVPVPVSRPSAGTRRCICVPVRIR